MANYTINNAGSTTCNYPSTINEGDVLTFNITKNAANSASNNTGTMLTYTFPCDCTAEILAAGAKGGNGAGYGTGGRGAIVAGTISFKTGDQLLICVGQAGTSGTLTSGSDGTTGAGGGGTYVVRKVNSSYYRYSGSGTGNNWYVEPLAIGAGGNGGGDNLYSGNSTVNASSNQGNENNFTYPTDSYQMGGGFSKCRQTSDSTSGRSFLTGASGATDYYNRSGTSYAGFGGGGANADDGSYGGGGGGYTGGEPGVAATSFVMTSASNISRKSGTQGNNGQGYVKITFKTVVPPIEFPPDEIVTQAGFDAKVKVDNAWKDGEKGYVKVNNEWKEIAKMYTKVNNAWVLTGEEKSFLVYTLLYQGYLNDKTIIGGYNGTATYSAYAAGTGITLSVAAKPSYGTAYQAAAGNFVNKVTNKVKTITFDYQRTTGSTNFDIGIYVSNTAQSGRLNSTTISGLTKAVQTVNSNSGTITINLEEVFGANLETYTNHYLGLYLYQSDGTALTVVIKNITYAEEHIDSGGQTPPPSGGDSDPGGSGGSGTVELIKNGVVNHYTQFGALSIDNYYVLDLVSEGVGINALGLLLPSYSNGDNYLATAFNGRIDLSTIDSIEVTWAPYNTSEDVNFNLYVTATKTAMQAMTMSSTMLGQYLIKEYCYISANSEEGLTYTTTTLTPNWTGTGYLCFAGSAFVDTGDTFDLLIRNLKVTFKGSSSGGGTGDEWTKLNMKSGGYDNNGVYDSMIYGVVCTQQYSVQQLFINNTLSYKFAAHLTSLQNIFIDAWGSSSYIGYYEFGTGVSGNVIGYITLSQVASALGVSTSQIKYVALSMYNSDGQSLSTTGNPIYAKMTAGATSGGNIRVQNGYYDNSTGQYSMYGNNEAVCTEKLSLSSVSNTQYMSFTFILSKTVVGDLNLHIWDRYGGYITCFPEYKIDFVAGKIEQAFFNKNDLASMIGTTANNIGQIALEFVALYGNTLVSSDVTVSCDIDLSGNGTGGSGGESGNTLQLNQGYFDSQSNKLVTDPEYVCTNKINVKSLSSSTNFTFTITSSKNEWASIYIDVWSSDGTQGNYMSYLDTSIQFTAGQPVPLTYSKEYLAYYLDLSDGSDIGHLVLNIYVGPAIYPSQYTVTYTTGSGGVTPRDDV